MIVAVVVAAGSSERFGSGLAKQFVDVAGKPLFLHSVEMLLQSPRLDGVVVVLPTDRPAEIESELEHLGILAVADGGEIRQSSVSHGLMCVPPEADIVAVHDGVRPLAAPDLIERLLGALNGSASGVVPGLPIDDAIKEVGTDGFIARTRSRAGIWRIQTPQMFRREVLDDCLARCDSQGFVGSDCAELLEHCGHRVKIILGDPANLKVTTRRDLAIVRALLEHRPVASSQPSAPRSRI